MVGEINRRDALKATGAAGLAGLLGFTGTGLAQDQRLSWHAGGTGGTYFPLSNELKTVVEDNTEFTLQVQSTGASVENVGSLSNGDADFALIQNDVAYFAYNGTGIDAFDGNPVENLRGVATLYPETIHVVTRPETGIETLEDLEGATINTGDLGSGTQVNALQILESAGITTDDFTEQNASFSQAADQLRDGDIDAAFVVGGWPLGAIEELATTSEISIVSISGDAREQILDASSWFAEDEIPAGTYSGVDEAVSTVSVQAMIATREELDAGTVETITQTIFENTDDLTIKTDFIGTDSALDGMSIPLHEGARAVLGPATTAAGETATNGTEMGTETATNGTEMGTTTES
ncbi:TAXI family TRAP transporter solute-binding subunit [Halorussus marinus]|uniref:TAXI family TRAP transporter solute-binding subunit n=1 Tax=Halorussus marinus TaxID=2505976 RepID=UPI00106E43C6|nr:TAXI family TRAP transporter solute-binding subunit [Halorussus marinus]